MSNKITTQLVIEGKNNSKRAFDEAEGSLTSLSKSAKAAGAVIAGALSASLFSDWIQGSIDAIDKTDELAERVGMAAGEFAALQYAAKFASVESDALASTLTKFNQSITKAADGSKKEAEAFATIGVAVRDSAGNVKAAGPLLSEVADRFAALPDGPQKAALAIDLFGKQGAKLLPLLNKGSAGIRELTEEAERLGLVLDSETYKAAGQFNDNLDALAGFSDAAGQQVAANLLPALNDITGLFKELATESEAASGSADVIGYGLKALTTVVVVLGTALKVTGDLLGGVASALYSLARGDLTGALDTLRDATLDYVQTTEDGISRVVKLWNGDYAQAGKAAAQTAKSLEAGFEEATSGMGQSVEDATGHMEKLTAIQKELVRDGQAALRQQVAAQRAANTELKKAQSEQLETAKRYQDALAKVRGGREQGTSYGAAQDLKISARNSLRAGNLDQAKQQAQAALDVLLRLSEEGANTYGFEGFIQELQAIEQAADKVKVDNATRSVDEATASVQKLKDALEPVKDIKVTINLTPEEIAKITSQMQGLADQLGQTLVIPATVVPVAPDGATGDASTYTGAQGFATGGHVRGPGSGTSDSILARLSNGEYVMRAAAVQQYGTALLDRMNGLRLPAFASGGLVDELASVQPASGRDLGRVDLHLPDGGVLPLLAPRDSFDVLLRRQTDKRGNRRR